MTDQQNATVADALGAALSSAPLSAFYGRWPGKLSQPLWILSTERRPQGVAIKL
jgi:hypothetical protein